MQFVLYESELVPSLYPALVSIPMHQLRKVVEGWPRILTPQDPAPAVYHLAASKTELVELSPGRTFHWTQNPNKNSACPLCTSNSRPRFKPMLHAPHTACIMHDAIFMSSLCVMLPIVLKRRLESQKMHVIIGTKRKRAKAPSVITR